MKNFLLRLVPPVTVLLVFLACGCAHLDPGANALVVRAEQTEVVALATFDLVLGIDNASRDFYKTNAPAFHAFCEWLRRPVSTGGTNTLPASLAMVQNLNNVKQAYVRSQVSSNVLASVIGVLSSSVEQAGQWILVVNKPVKP